MSSKKQFPCTPSGKFLVEFRKGRDPERPNARSRTFATNAEAYEYWKNLPDRRKKRSTGGITFAELGNKYLVAKVGSMSVSDQDNTFYKLDSIIYPRLGNSPADGINSEAIDKYIVGRLQDHVQIYIGGCDREKAKRKKKLYKKGSKKVSLPTVYRELDIIRAILNWAVDRKFIVSNPMAGYRRDKKKGTGQIILPPTEEDYRAILKHSSPHCKRFIMLSYYTGLRPGKVEAYGLKWEHVDFENETIQIISAEKGGAALRTIALHENLLYALRWWKASDEQRGYCGGYIINYNWRPVTSSMKTAWAGAKRRAGITRPLRPYSLRHKTATDLLRHTGGDVKTAAQILGNDPKTLMEYYQSVDSEQKRRAVRGLK